MIRTFGRRFVFALATTLLLAQQASVLHALSHGVGALAAATGDAPRKGNPAADQHCELCPIHAQFLAAAPPSLLPPPVAEVVRVVSVSADLATIARISYPYRSRAPPRTA